MSDLIRFANVLIDHGLTEEALRNVRQHPHIARLCALIANEVAAEEKRRNRLFLATSKHPAYHDKAPGRYAVARIRAGFPTYVIAAALGVSPALINDAENLERLGYRNFKPRTLVRLQRIRAEYERLFPELKLAKAAQ